MTMIDVHPAGESEHLGGYRDWNKRNQQQESGAAASEGWNPKNNISRRDFKISCLAGVAGVDFPLYIT
jgi:hypothetical protein